VFFAALLEMPQSRLEIAESFLALGQLDLDLGRLTFALRPGSFESSDLLVELSELRFQRLQRCLELGLTPLYVGQSGGGVLVLLFGGRGFLLKGVALPGELLASLAGGGSLEATLGKRVGCLGFGPAVFDQCILGGGEFGLLRGDLEFDLIDLSVELTELLAKRPELTASRDQPGGLLSRPNDQRSVRAQQLAGDGYKADTRMRSRQLNGMPEVLDDPGGAEQPLDQGAELRIGFNKPIHSAHDAGRTVEIRNLSSHGRLNRPGFSIRRCPLSLRERARVRALCLVRQAQSGIPSRPLSLRERARVRALCPVRQARQLRSPQPRFTLFRLEPKKTDSTGQPSGGLAEVLDQRRAV